MTTSTTAEKSEIEWLKSTLIPEIFKNKNFQKDHGLQNYINDQVKLHKIEVKFIGAEEAFMLTVCYRALITFEQGDSGPKTSQLIVKVFKSSRQCIFFWLLSVLVEDCCGEAEAKCKFASVNGVELAHLNSPNLRTPKLSEEMLEKIQFSSLFSNEIVTYKTIMPALEKLSQQTINIPRFYYGDLGKNYASLALQDFGVNDWRIAEQKVNLSLGHVLVALGNLGTFHGLGFALRHKDRAEFDRITKDLKESRFSKDEIPEGFAIKLSTSAERVVIATKKYQPHIEVEFLERFERLIKDFVKFGRQMVKPVEPLVTLCHGDYLRNNIAFKYSKDNKEPSDSLIFDLQTMRLCSPMLDFAVFLSLCCYAAIRNEHFNEIFDKYYSQLTKTFKESTQVAKLPDFLSRESLLAEYRRYLPMGIGTASFFLMDLVEPHQVTSEEYLTREVTAEEERKDVLRRGGEIVDREIAHQVKELYDFIQMYKLDIFKGFDYV